MEACSGFVNNELFEAALDDFFNEKVEVVGFRGTTAVLKGDNYTSDTYKVTVTFRRNKGWVAVFVKFCLVFRGPSKSTFFNSRF